MKSARPTLKDIAEHSGFALRTVIKAMNGDPSVREKNRDAILRAAEELHYTPNRAASALGKKKSVTLAVVYSNTSDVYFPEIEKGLRQCLSEFCDFGLAMEFHTTTEREWQAQQPILETLLQREDIDGVVMQPQDGSKLDPLINALVDAGKPVAIFGTDAPASKRMLYVSCDAYRAGRIGGQLLEREIPQNGCVCVMNASSDQLQILKRTQGCLDRIRENRPDIRLTTCWDMDPRAFRETLYGMICEDAVDGIFCDDAQTIVAAELLEELGRKDIPLVGFDLFEKSEQYMKAGYIRVILDQKPEVFSYLAAKSLFEYLADGVVPERFFYTPIYILTSECL